MNCKFKDFSDRHRIGDLRASEARPSAGKVVLVMKSTKEKEIVKSALIIEYKKAIIEKFGKEKRGLYKDGNVTVAGNIQTEYVQINFDLVDALAEEKAARWMTENMKTS